MLHDLSYGTKLVESSVIDMLLYLKTCVIVLLMHILELRRLYRLL